MLEAQGEIEAALEAYRAAIDVNPNLASAHYNAARVYSQAGEVEECLRHLDSVLSLAPELAGDAAQDEHLGWALRLREMRETHGGDAAP